MDLKSKLIPLIPTGDTVLALRCSTYGCCLADQVVPKETGPITLYSDISEDIFAQSAQRHHTFHPAYKELLS
ncbi:hypothetical protein V6N13_021349 [Hibiscus sabdariffa]